MSVTVRQDPAVKRAISTIPEDAWTPIEYTDAIFDEQARTWISKVDVAEVPFTAFTSRAKNDHVTGRLVVRRIPELNRKHVQHPTLFDTHRFHAFLATSTLDTVTADQVPDQHDVGELLSKHREGVGSEAPVNEQCRRVRRGLDGSKSDHADPGPIAAVFRVPSQGWGKRS